MTIFRPLLKLQFWGLKWFFLSKISKTDFVRHNFCKKKKAIREISIFGQNPRTNFFKKMSIFWPSLKRHFFGFTMFVFYPEYLKNHFFWHNFCKKHPYEKFRFLDKIHGLTRLENVYFLALFKTSIFST